MFILFLQTGTTALFFAAQGGYMDIASLLLEHGAIVDSCSIVSERQRRVNEISMLFKHQFIPRGFQDGGTPLFVACQYGHLDVVEGLIERGANPNAHMKVREQNYSLHTDTILYIEHEKIRG